MQQGLGRDAAAVEADAAGVGAWSMSVTSMPRSAARNAAGYPPGPAPMHDELAFLHNRKACYHKTAASQVRRAGACCCRFKERRAEDQARIEPQSNAVGGFRSSMKPV